MKHLLAAAMLAALTTPAIATDVGVSISIGQPGFYGRIDIGGFPQPRVIYRQPVIVERISVERPPIYLRVPAGHARHWSKHCHEYNACDERVLFVRDDWYSREYVPRYRERHDYRDDRHDGHWDEHRDDRRDGWGDDHRSGRGNDRLVDPREHGEGHGQGRGR